MNTALAMGKVIHVRITMTEADGKEYSRPIQCGPQLSPIEVAKTCQPRRKGDDEPPTDEPIDLNLMPWIQRWMEEKAAPQKKRSLLYRIFKYMKEFI